MNDPFDDGERGRILTDEQVDYIRDWLRSHADRLGLRDWRIYVSPFHCKSGIAGSHIRDAADETFVAVSQDFLDDTPDEQRDSLTHELLHPHFYRVTRLAEQLIAGELGKRTEAVIETAVEGIEELVIERLAHGIATMLDPFALPEGAA